MIVQHFDTPPSMAALYLRCLTGRHDKTVSTLPELRIEIERTPIDRQQLSNYLTAFGSGNNTILPPPFIYLATQFSQMALLTHHQFPLSPLGLVHLGIRFDQSQDIAVPEALHIRTEINDQFASDKGLVFELVTTVPGARGQNLFSMRNHYLAKAIRPDRERPLPNLCDVEENSLNRPSATTEICLQKDAGRRYARLSGDYNPIHLYGWSAKLLGFRRPIIHGLYLIARSYAELYRSQGRYPLRSRFQFKSPLYLPGKARLERFEESPKETIVVRSESRDHLYGQIDWST